MKLIDEEGSDRSLFCLPLRIYNQQTGEILHYNQDESTGNITLTPSLGVGRLAFDFQITCVSSKVNNSKFCLSLSNAAKQQIETNGITVFSKRKRNRIKTNEKQEQALQTNNNDKNNDKNNEKPKYYVTKLRRMNSTNCEEMVLHDKIKKLNDLVRKQQQQIHEQEEKILYLKVQQQNQHEEIQNLRITLLNRDDVTDYQERFNSPTTAIKQPPIRKRMELSRMKSLEEMLIDFE